MPAPGRVVRVRKGKAAPERRSGRSGGDEVGGLPGRQRQRRDAKRGAFGDVGTVGFQHGTSFQKVCGGTLDSSGSTRKELKFDSELGKTGLRIVNQAHDICVTTTDKRRQRRSR